MRKIILTLCFFFCVMSLSAFPIVAVENDGNRQELDFEDVGKILFDDSNGQVSMVITLLFDDSSLVNVSKILFREEITPNPDESSEDEETAVPNNAVKPIIRVEKGKIESNQPFEIYNILGMKVTSRNGFLPKGVYLVVFENDVLKTLVR